MRQKGMMVQLRGDWSREDTTPSDITMMRTIGARLRRLAAAGDMPTVQFQVHAHQAKFCRERTGTFKATVFVETNKYAVGQLTLASRAKNILRWFLSDVTCRPPKLSNIELVNVKGASRYTVEGPI